MNISKVKKRQVFNISLNSFADKLNLVEPALIQISWLTRIFGCRHKKTGIPFTRGRQTYRTCMLCGASQKFDVKLWKNTGPFYYNPVLALYDLPAEKTSETSQLVSSFEIDRWVEDGGRNFEQSENED
jgi:hypothetical protein